MTTEANTEAIYELTACKRALSEVRGKFVEDAERLETLPDIPAHFRPLVGTYYRVSTEAVRRNEAQRRSGFIDYIYCPEPVAAEPAKTAEA